MAEETAFLREIGYLLPEPAAFPIGTSNVDPEIATLAGPQLVVPVSNARYALNAANARWGSLYDALYGTDAPGAADRRPRATTRRAARKVIAYARACWTASRRSPRAATRTPAATTSTASALVGRAGRTATRAAWPTPRQFAGCRGDAAAPRRDPAQAQRPAHRDPIDRDHPIGKDDPAGVADVVVEAALTTIQDCEDSVAAVDAEDKVGVYRNWLGLMKRRPRGQLRQGRPHRRPAGWTPTAPTPPRTAASSPCRAAA